MGLLRLDSGAGGVILGLSDITWFTHPDTFVVAGGTTLTSAAGNPDVGSTGDLNDLNFPAGLPVPNFLTFNTVVVLAFDLTAIGPGSSNTNCSGLAVGGSCSVFLTSPFILTLTPTGTTMSFSVAGVAHDDTLPDADWVGLFTTQFVTLTPLDIQRIYGCHTGDTSPFQCENQSATITSSYSGEFLTTPQVSQVPKPHAIGLTVLGARFPGVVGAKKLRKFPLG
jgi:hypothetical protein